jgi:hypothetical protein
MTNKLSLILPDGSSTSKLEIFNSEWDKIIKPFEDMGFQLVGYSPGIFLCNKATGSGSFELPVYAAKRIIENLQKKELDNNDK